MGKPFEDSDDVTSGEARESRLHILVIPTAYPCFHSPIDGIYVQEQACAVQSTGARVGVVYPDLRSWRTLNAGQFTKCLFQTTTDSEDGINVIRVQGWNVPLGKLGPRLWRILAMRLLATYIKRFGRPDLCHAHNAIWAGTVAREAKKRFGIPYVLTEHSTAYRRNLFRAYQERLTREVFSDAFEVIAVSKGLRSDLQRFIQDREIRVIPNMVNVDYFSLPETPIEEKPFRFLSVSMLTQRKGIDILIRAFHRAFSEREDIVLEVAGEGPERGDLEELTRDLKIADRVCFSGLLTREQVRETMWRSNVFVLASHIETFGVVLIEALATGLPVIATRCGGPEDFVDDEVGFLVEPGNVSALAQVLKQAWAERSRFNKYRLREYASQNFSSVAVSKEICDTYRRVRCNQK